MLGRYEVLLANIDGKKVASYSILKRRLTVQELFDCIINQNEMGELLDIPQIKFMNDKDKAAEKVQSLFKMMVVRKDYRRVKVLIKKVIIIQKNARIYIEHQIMKRKI